MNEDISKLTIKRVIIENYDVNRGDRFFAPENINGTYSWSVQVIYKDLTGSLNGQVTIYGNNEDPQVVGQDINRYFKLEGLNPTNNNPIVLNSANGSKYQENYFLSCTNLGFKFEKKDLTGGTITIITVLNRSL